MYQNDANSCYFCENDMSHICTNTTENTDIWKPCSNCYGHNNGLPCLNCHDKYLKCDSFECVLCKKHFNEKGCTTCSPICQMAIINIYVLNKEITNPCLECYALHKGNVNACGKCNDNFDIRNETYNAVLNIALLFRNSKTPCVNCFNKHIKDKTICENCDDFELVDDNQ